MLKMQLKGASAIQCDLAIGTLAMGVFGGIDGISAADICPRASA